MRKNHISGYLKRILAVACAAAMVATSVPTSTAFATEPTGDNQTNETTQVEEPADNTPAAEENTDTPEGEENTNKEDPENSSEGESTKQSEEGGSQTGEGGSQTGEGGSQTGEGGSQTGEGGSQTGEGGSQTGEGGSQTGEGGSQTGEGGSQTGEGGSQTGEGGSQTGEGGSQTGEGGSQTGEGGEDQQDPEVEKNIKVDIEIDDNASVMEEGEYKKLVFNASAKDTSSLGTAINKIEYMLLNSDGETMKSGEIGDKGITIESTDKDLKKKFEEYTLKITATDEEGDTTENTEEIKFYYEKPAVEIKINKEQSKTVKDNDGQYTTLVFGAEAAVDSETELEQFSYVLKLGDTVAEGTFGSNETVSINAQELGTRGDYSLKVTAKDKNGETGSAEANVFMAYDGEAPTFDYKVTPVIEGLGFLDLGKEALVYELTVNDQSEIVKISYEVISYDGVTYEKRELPKGETSFTVECPKKGYVEVVAEDEYGNSNIEDPYVTKALVIENRAPEVSASLGSADTEAIAKKHSFEVDALDLPEKEYSGLQKVDWKVVDFSGRTVASGNIFEYKEGDAKPDKLDDLKEKFSSSVVIEGQYDGLYTFKATATDWCGNSADSIVENVVFDNTAPTVKFSTDDKYKNDPSENTKSILNNEGSIKVEIADALGEGETDNHTFNYTVKIKQGENEKLLYDNVEGTGTETVELDISELRLGDDEEGLADGTYIITVSATDKAGNEMKEESFEFTVDNKSPEITITYNSEKTAYVYKEEEGYFAYYAGDVNVTFAMDDNTNSKDDHIYINDNSEGINVEKDCEEGVTVYKVYGEDAAGNPAKIREVWSSSSVVIDKTEESPSIVELVGNFSEDHGNKEKEYITRVAVVVDKKGPEVFITADGPVADDSLEENIRRYYSKDFDVTLTVNDNFALDTELITAKKLYNNAGGDYKYKYNLINTDTVIDKDFQYDMDAEIKDKQILYKTSVVADTTGNAVGDGVYRFYISGTDKAGNGITVHPDSSGENENQLIDKTDYLISQPKVLDTIAPELELFTKVGEDTIYDLIVQKNKRKVRAYKPFQKNVEANISYRTKDNSPSMLSVDIESTNKEAGANSIVTDYDYVDAEKQLHKVEAKRQIITLKNIVLKDRAGNTAELKKSNELIFDDEKPKKDIVAPEATIEANEAVTYRNADGRDLFNYAPTINVTVSDPGEGVNSSGLKSVDYVVYVDNKKVDSDSVTYDTYVKPEEAIETKKEGVVVNNNKLTYEKKFSVRLSESYQTNNIVIKVHAMDNSGNEMQEATYECGIDTVGPEIVVSFDNNNARNSKYFKNNRTATITVTDRNVSNSKIPITTQVPIPGSFSYHKGSGNGANDQWIKKLNYSTDGDYTLRLGKCTDALGNSGTVKYTGTAANSFIIDKTKPVIKVEFNNNNVQNQKYYKDPRRATVTVTDHNFSASDTRIETQVTPGGFSDTNRDTHIAYVDYNNDGNYTMYVTSTDLAGNEQVQTIRIDEFVIDRTAPVINVSFDNNDAQNGKYYKDARTATISVREHNFNASEVNVTQTADIQQGSVSAPGVGGFGGGGDDHSASIHYGEDGNYTLTVNYTDLAGNPAQEVRVDEFVIDQTPPTLKFVMPDETKGLNQIFAGDIAPQIEFGDINMTRGMASIELTGMKKNNNALNLIEDSFENYQGTVRYENLKKVRGSDDIYTATAVVTDLAGNTVEKTITFSVNRFGSTYDYNKHEFTTNLVSGYYTNESKDVILREINVNQLSEHKLTLYKDGDNRTLVEGTDYSFEEKLVNGHYEYIYTIFAKNFEEEGNYNIIATSKDKANNTNTNSTVKGDDGSNEVPLRFAVDKTAPTNLITGVDITKNKFTEDHITLYIEPRDNMNAVASFIVRVTDRNGNILQEFKISGKELAEYFEKNNGVYTLTIDQNNQWQTIEVITTDAAGNESVDRRIDQNTAYQVLVTPNLFYQYINRLPLVGGTLAVLAGLIIFLIAKRRKDDEEEESAG